jgi:hypothetical protein
MNCSRLQRRLLAMEKPSRPPADLQAHLTACSACREWQQRLVQLEREVQQVPVPPSTARSAFVQRLLANGANRQPAERKSPTVPLRGARREWTMRKIAAATALAASLLIVGLFLGISRWGTQDKSAHSDLVAALLAHDVKLAGAQMPTERLKTLSKLADDLQGQASPLAKDGKAGEDLETLASLYVKVMEEGILPRVAAIPLPDRDNKVILQIANKLDVSSSDLELLAQGCPAGEPSLRRMANAARQAAAGLRDEAAHAHALLLPLRNADMPLMAWCLLDGGTFATAPVLAVSSTTSSSIVDPVRRFHQNRHLIRSLVNSGVALARLNGKDEDALKRAQRCAELAKDLAEEFAQAGEERQEELGRFLQMLLKDGVSANVDTAGGFIPEGSEDRKPLLEVKDRAAALKMQLDKSKKP